MKTYKFFALFAALFSAMSFVACGGEAVPAEENEIAVSEEVAPALTTELKLIENGEPLYVIVRGENAPQYEIDQAMRLRTALEEKTGVRFKLETDWTEADAAKCEILVGTTSRTSDETYSAMGVLEYRIAVNGNKIEILSRSTSGLEAAVDEFLADGYLTAEGRIPSAPVSGIATLAAGEVPPFEYGKTEGIYECSGETIVQKISDTTETDYRTYVELLMEMGYTEYASNQINENSYITLVNGTTTVNCYYFAENGITRVVSEPKGALYPRAEDNTYTDAGIECLLTGMKGETVVASEGMGFIVRLCDGSFVIIDGGMGDPDSVDSDKLMKILNEQKPEGAEKPVIAAWLFTHLHGDHVGVFNCFSIDHHDEVEIEAFYYNFPTEEQIDGSDSPYMNDDTIYRFTQFKKCMSEYYPDVPNIKVHTENKFHVRNAEFEVLLTLEDVLPKTIEDIGMNESDTLYRMTLEGQTTMWCGDLGYYEDDLVVEAYGDYLKSDFLQLAHHGMNGSVEFYSIIDPVYAILPTSWEGGYESMRGYEQNQWVINSPDLKHFICTSYGTWTIRLPYEPVEGTFDKLPSWKTQYPTYPQLLGEN